MLEHSQLLPAALIGLALAVGTPPAGQQAPSRALITVRTLVIDGMGTRTVDTDTARVPFGHKGILTKKVAYAGPPLSYRLAVTAGPPQEAGIPLSFSTDVWTGEASPMPPPDRMDHREEATVVSPQGSYLLEVEHDEATDRRVMLSITARPIGENEEMPPLPPADTAGRVQFLLEISRQQGGAPDQPDRQLLATIIGRPVTYSSGVILPGKAQESSASGERTLTVGLTVVLTAERASGDLVTVRLELSGADYVDEQRTRLEPLRYDDVRTVSSGATFEVTVTLPPGSPEAAPGFQPVTYRIAVTSSLG